MGPRSQWGTVPLPSTLRPCCPGKPRTWRLFAERAARPAAFSPAESSCLGVRMPPRCHQRSLSLDSLSDVQSDSTVGGGLMARKRHGSSASASSPRSAPPRPAQRWPSRVGRGGVGLCAGGSAGLTALRADSGPPLVLGCTSAPQRHPGSSRVSARRPGPLRKPEPLLGNMGPGPCWGSPWARPGKAKENKRLLPARGFVCGGKGDSQ